ncbi:hypothetical protein PTE30175_01878 [Pandoraea terrae]|uniref:Uncharacterized protein n=1 Tax=Pandoraea terrae TaxID=1537710 RepID=A0A5E4UCD7_9BURK|nr:hypothetical protein PTE30175_01878 [Pandoraea terrae]
MIICTDIGILSYAAHQYGEFRAEVVKTIFPVFRWS